MIRRINLFGGPCLGKTTSAAFLFHQLKKRHVNVELCREEAKIMAYLGESTAKRQGELFQKQINEEVTFLDNGVDLVIVDSPVLLAVSYGMKHGETEAFEQKYGYFYGKYDKEYPSLNVILRRGNSDYNETGRFENRDEAVEMDRIILDHYKKWSYNGGENMVEVDCFDEDSLLRITLERLEISPPLPSS